MVSSSGSEKIQLDTPLATSDFLSFAVMNRFGWRSLPLWAAAEDCSLLILDSGLQILYMQTICSLVFGAFQPSTSPVLRVSLQHYTHNVAVILHDYTRLKGWPWLWLECPHFAGQMLILVVTMFEISHTHTQMSTSVFCDIISYHASCLIISISNSSTTGERSPSSYLPLKGLQRSINNKVYKLGKTNICTVTLCWWWITLRLYIIYGTQHGLVSICWFYQSFSKVSHQSVTGH